MTLDEMLTELQEAGNYEGTEVGDYWNALVLFDPRMDEQISPEFLEAWKKEVETQFCYMKQNTRWVEEQIETRVTSRKRLEWTNQ